LNDNYVTTRQIHNFFNEKQLKSRVFEPKDIAAVKASFQEIEKDYQTIQTIRNDPEKCQETREMIINTVHKCEKFAPQVYTLVKHANTFDLFISACAIFSFAVNIISYILSVQYIYVSGDKEKEFNVFSLNHLKSAKSLLPLLIMNIIGGLAAWKYNDVYAYPLAACLIITEFWYCGSIAISFLNLKALKSPNFQQQQKIDSEPIEIATTEKTIGNTDTSINHQDNISLVHMTERSPLGSKFFLSQTPIQSLCALILLVYLLYLIHLKNFFSLRSKYIVPTAPFISLLLMIYLITKRIAPARKFLYPIMITAALLLWAIPKYADLNLSHFPYRQYLGLILIAEWGLREIFNMRNQLQTTKLFTGIQVITLGTVCYYQVQKANHADILIPLVEIILPRIIWGLLSSSLILGYVQKANRPASKRNFHFCLVMFLVLLRIPREIIFFGNLLHLMDITTNFFIKAKVQNYLYSLFIGYLSYIGLFYLLLTDYFVIMNFTPAFIGLTDFNPVICPILFLLYLMSSFILGTVFISKYNQALPEKIQLPDLADTKTENIAGGIEIQRKRNVFIVVFFFGFISLSSCFKVYFLRDQHLDFEFEKFFIDAAFYFYFIICGFFLLSK